MPFRQFSKSQSARFASMLNSGPRCRQVKEYWLNWVEGIAGKQRQSNGRETVDGTVTKGEQRIVENDIFITFHKDLKRKETSEIARSSHQAPRKQLN